MSAKYQFFCAEINVDNARLYGAQNGLQLVSSISTLKDNYKKVIGRAQENGGSGFQDKPWNHNFGGVS